jgi:hypothetical protein
MYVRVVVPNESNYHGLWMLAEREPYIQKDIKKGYWYDMPSGPSNPMYGKSME